MYNKWYSLPIALFSANYGILINYSELQKRRNILSVFGPFGNLINVHFKTETKQTTNNLNDLYSYMQDCLRLQNIFYFDPESRVFIYLYSVNKSTATLNVNMAHTVKHILCHSSI